MAHIRYASPEAVLDALVDRHPILAPQKEDIRALYELIRQSFASGGKLLVCGNGGSAADNTISAISGATITSKAVTKAVNCALQAAENGGISK